MQDFFERSGETWIAPRIFPRGNLWSHYWGTSQTEMQDNLRTPESHTKEMRLHGFELGEKNNRLHYNSRKQIINWKRRKLVNVINGKNLSSQSLHRLFQQHSSHWRRKSRIKKSGYIAIRTTNPPWGTKVLKLGLDRTSRNTLRVYKTTIGSKAEHPHKRFDSIFLWKSCLKL